MRTARRLVSSIAWALIVTASALSAAETGRVAGIVVDARTGEPAVGATIRMEGTDIGAVADARGRFVLPGVPTGPRILRVERIGIRRLRAGVEVAAGGETWIRLSIDSEAVLGAEVTVTGDREPARDLEAGPTFATVIEAPASRGGATSLPEVLSATAGVQVQTLGGLGSFSTMSIRGSSAEQVQVYLDGVLLNGAMGGGVNMSDIPTSDVERIEVFRGQAPAWEGGEGMGGVVHIRTWRAGDRAAQRGSISAGSFRTGQGSWTVTRRDGRLGFLVSADLGRSANHYRFHDDNGTEYNPDDDGVSRRLNNDFSALQLLARVGWEGGERLSFSVSNRLFRKGQGIPNVSNNQSLRARFDTFRDAVEASSELRGLMGDRVTLRQVLSFSHLAEDFHNRYGEVGLGAQDNHNVTRALAIRQAIRGAVRRHHVVTAFWEVRREGFTPSDRLSAGTRFLSSRRWVLSAGIEEEGFWWRDRVGLVTGARTERGWDRFFGNAAYTGSPVAPARNRSESAWSLHQGIRYTLHPRVILKANVGRYGRPPSFYELFGDRGGVMGNTDLKPESGVTWDAGLRSDCRGDGVLRNLFLEASYYDRRAENLIQFLQQSQGISRAGNIGRARVRGTEISTRADLWGWFRIGGNYTYQDARDRSDIPHRRNKILPNRPRHEGEVTGEMEVGRFRVGYSPSFQGGSFLDRANLRPVRAKVVHNGGAVLRIHRSIRISADVKNATGNQVADVWGYPLPGRGFFFGMSGQF